MEDKLGDDYRGIMMNRDDWYTIEEFAAAIGYSVSWVRQLLSRKELPGARKRASTWFIPCQAAEAYRDGLAKRKIHRYRTGREGVLSPSADIGKLEDGTIAMPLTQGAVTVIDKEDADLAKDSWFRGGKDNRYYAARQRHISDVSLGLYKRGHVTLHRTILERMLGRPLETREEVDHINGDALDNRRCNLRLATRSTNNRNRRGWGKYGKGVRYDKQSGKYTATLQLGSFDTPEEAAAAWEEAARILRGEARA